VGFSASEKFFKNIFFDFELDYLKSVFFVQALGNRGRRDLIFRFVQFEEYGKKKNGDAVCSTQSSPSITISRAIGFIII
jgi:hypothetical protein